ncbi:M3 family oligoendopeptidase [Paenibacillus yanchengensis]|uniref:M3 family oligoendopeptidase n=1 Tax=Paenibacillus yanchengensis TaxID=2035833 RepID=A0ABW4YFV8_9BACL
MELHNLSLQWDLDPIYDGGATSEKLLQELRELEEQLETISRMLLTVDDQPEARQQWVQITALMQQCLLTIREAESFVSCLLAQYVADTAAQQLQDRIATLIARYTALTTVFDTKLLQLTDERWGDLLLDPALAEIAFYLEERRLLAQQKLAPELEEWTAQLEIDGYHGWAEFYNSLAGRLQFQATDDQGQPEFLSVGQMQNRLSEADRTKREMVFAEWEKVWASHADLFATVINRISGFRLKLYNKREWQSVLKEPLFINRMSAETLEAMWSAVSKGKQILLPYLVRKAELLGVDKLHWHDVEAPLAVSNRVMSYDEAANFIVDQFAKFDGDMAQFSAMALKKQWVEAEDRPGKRAGGFCTSFPKTGETRIFMTYSGSMSNVSTLAHELGHAYHQHVMKDIAPFSQQYAMNVAETASTFAELLVSDGALQATSNKEEKIALLEDKIQRAVAFYMNIHARFLFETRFYEARAKGFVQVEQLNQLMEQAQQEAYLGTIEQLHPHFWASKLHFYLTDVPFYNFPYTFGYLFSAGLYQYAKQDKSDFAKRYVALLQDTGRMTVEQLAEKHLQVDLTKPDFWDAAAMLIEQDVAQFLILTEQEK